MLNPLPAPDISLQGNDPLLGQSPWKNKLSGTEGDTLGGFPVKFLVQVVSLAHLNLSAWYTVFRGVYSKLQNYWHP